MYAHLRQAGVILVLCLLTSTTHASKLIDDTTLGIWVDSTLGVAARFGLALEPSSERDVLVAGGEVGTNGSKQFIGYRSICGRQCSSPGVAGIELAHWRTRQPLLLADDHADYVGVSVYTIFFRFGLMLPASRGAHVSVTTAVGVGF